jgi:LAS superfamily LD-carboxypeptidase LdcB
LYHRIVTGPVRSFDESVLKTFLATLNRLEADRILTPVITLGHLQAILDVGQRALVDQIIGLNPEDYGVATPYAGDLEPVPADLVRVAGQQYTEQGELRTLGDKYVPRTVFEQYTRMNDAYVGEHPRRRLLIQSCYRSPAYQVAVFVGLLVTRYDGDIGRTIRHASPPSYSQHTIASKAAIDFKNVDGSPSAVDPGDFAATAEYAWLRRYAATFRFHESWPLGNEFGMRAEPWHWQYRPQERAMSSPGLLDSASTVSASIPSASCRGDEGQ